MAVNGTEMDVDTPAAPVAEKTGTSEKKSKKNVVFDADGTPMRKPRMRLEKKLRAEGAAAGTPKTPATLQTPAKAALAHELQTPTPMDSTPRQFKKKDGERKKLLQRQFEEKAEEEVFFTPAADRTALKDIQTPGGDRELFFTPGKTPAPVKTPGNKKRKMKALGDTPLPKFATPEEIEKARKDRVAAVVENIRRDIVAKGHEKTRDAGHGEDLEVARIRQARVPWKISSTLGGRFSKLKPVFSQDEKHLLVARQDSIQVYATKTSLLVRSIALPVITNASNPYYKPRIVGFHTNPYKWSEIFVATSAGKLFLVDWSEDEILQTWTFGKHITKLKAAPLPEGDGYAGAVYIVSRFSKDSLYNGAIYRLDLKSMTEEGAAAERAFETTYVYDARYEVLDFEMIDDGDAAVVLTHNTVHLVKGIEGEEDEDMTVELITSPMGYSFTTLAVRGTESAPSKPVGKKKNMVEVRNSTICYDFAVGTTAGSVHVYEDVLSKDDNSAARTLHWHVKPVMSIAWSVDGNYLISGGHEAVLVIWQLETSQKQFLPYLSGEIEDLVVSPKGASYGIRFSDNSIIVLSTSELKARANVTGIQANVVLNRDQLNPSVSRVPFIAHPTSLNQVLYTASSKCSREAPFIQSFDTFSDRAITKQALARNNMTIRQLGPNGRDLIEPNIEHIAVTADGKWLATIDTWRPTPAEFNAPSADEMYLKFWEWNGDAKQWELVTRVDSPHPSEYKLTPSAVLDLVALPKSRGFITLGAEGSVRIWKPRNRVRGGVTVKSAEGTLMSWSCRRVVQFSIPSQIGPLIASAKHASVQRVAPKTWGALAISRDESVLAVAFPESGDPDASDSTIYLINPASGTINQVLSGFDLGPVHGLEIVGRYLAIAGDDAVLAWDLVMGKVAWALDLELLRIQPDRILKDGVSVLMAADTDNETIAVAYNYLAGTSEAGRPAARIVVWNVGSAVPLHVENTEVWISNLTRNSAGRGFVFLNAEARISYLTPAVAPHITTPSSRSVTPRASSKEADENLGLSSVYGLGSRSETEKEDDDEESEEDEDMWDVSKVMPVERIREVFEVDGGFEVGGLAERFDALMGLLGRKPLPEEEEEEGEEMEVE